MKKAGKMEVHWAINGCGDSVDFFKRFLWKLKPTHKHSPNKTLFLRSWVPIMSTRAIRMALIRCKWRSGMTRCKTNSKIEFLFQENFALWAHWTVSLFGLKPIESKHSEIENLMRRQISRVTITSYLTQHTQVQHLVLGDAVENKWRSMCSVQREAFNEKRWIRSTKWKANLVGSLRSDQQQRSRRD